MLNVQCLILKYEEKEIFELKVSYPLTTDHSQLTNFAAYSLLSECFGSSEVEAKGMWGQAGIYIQSCTGGFV